MKSSLSRRTPLLFLVALTALGCAKEESAKPAPAVSAPPAVTPPMSAAPSGSAAPAASGSAPAAAPAGEKGSFEGTFTSKVAKVTPPAEAKVKLWEKDPGKDGVGAGTIKLTISGRVVSGEVTGALGALVVSGDLDDKVLTARLDPKDPNAQDAWTGTLTGKVEADGIAIVLRVASRNANLAREADAKLAKR